METEISRSDINFKMWDKYRMIIILSTTILTRNIIFVGDKNNSLIVLRYLLLRKDSRQIIWKKSYQFYLLIQDKVTSENR